MSDLLLDLMQALRPRAVLFGGVDACGSWGLGFRKRDDLLFCWVERGECLMVWPDGESLRLRTGDFVLMRTTTPFALASEASATVVDSETAVTAARGKRLRLGSGDERQVSLHAGKIVISSANEGLLDKLLPPTVRVLAANPSVGCIRSLLSMNEAEARYPGPASDFVRVRLVELLLVEILRAGLATVPAEKTGILAGLADAQTRRAVDAMHGDITRNWTVAELAKLSGTSRAGFAARFKRVLGMGPIQYLLGWRIALAKDDLRHSKKTVAEIAFSVGFGSSSAFSSAFTRKVGCSPTEFARETVPG